jgi:hypothetical protein
MTRTIDKNGNNVVVHLADSWVRSNFLPEYIAQVIKDYHNGTHCWFGNDTEKNVSKFLIEAVTKEQENGGNLKKSKDYEQQMWGDQGMMTIVAVEKN